MTLSSWSSCLCLLKASSFSLISSIRSASFQLCPLRLQSCSVCQLAHYHVWQHTSPRPRVARDGGKKISSPQFSWSLPSPPQLVPNLGTHIYLFRQWETLNKLLFCTPCPLLPLHPVYHAAAGPWDIYKKKEAFPNRWFLVTWILIPGTVLSEKRRLQHLWAACLCTAAWPEGNSGFLSYCS